MEIKNQILKTNDADIPLWKGARARIKGGYLDLAIESRLIGNETWTQKLRVEGMTYGRTFNDNPGLSVEYPERDRFLRDQLSHFLQLPDPDAASILDEIQEKIAEPEQHVLEMNQLLDRIQEEDDGKPDTSLRLYREEVSVITRSNIDENEQLHTVVFISDSRRGKTLARLETGGREFTLRSPQARPPEDTS